MDPDGKFLSIFVETRLYLSIKIFIYLKIYSLFYFHIPSLQLTLPGKMQFSFLEFLVLEESCQQKGEPKKVYPAFLKERDLFCSSKADTSFHQNSATLPCLWTNVTFFTPQVRRSLAQRQNAPIFQLMCISSILFIYGVSSKWGRAGSNRSCYPAKLGVTCLCGSLFAYHGSTCRSSAGAGHYHFAEQRHHHIDSHLPLFNNTWSIA